MRLMTFSFPGAQTLIAKQYLQICKRLELPSDVAGERATAEKLGSGIDERDKDE